MAKDLAENLVRLGDRSLRANTSAELGLNHGEGRLDVRPLVVVRAELFALIHEQMERFGPQVSRSRRIKTVRLSAGRVLLERERLC